MKQISLASSPLALYAANPRVFDLEDANRLEPLVLGHALGSSHEMWEDVLPLLPDTLPVILWDLPGHGGSDLLASSQPDARDAAEALNQALRDLGVGRAHIGGLSLGAMISLAYAQSFPDQTLTLAMMDSGPSNPPPTMWEGRARQVEAEGIAPLAEATMERWFTPDFASGPGADQVQRIRRIFLNTGAAGYAQCCRILQNTDLWAEMGRVTMPSLILTGAEDSGFTPEGAEALVQSLPRPQNPHLSSNPVIVEDARHQTAVQQPAAVARALSGLVAGSGTAAAGYEMGKLVSKSGASGPRVCAHERMVSSSMSPLS